jgi:acyl carrier protein
VGLFAQYIETLAPIFVHLRYLIVGGDVLDPAIVRRVMRSSPPQHLLNAYGPTECTTFSTTYLIREIPDDRIIPIGRPISNAQIYILDRHMQPTPIGIPGEIYIGGAGVALGYLNRPDLTAERFIRCRLHGDQGVRLYRSGDLARWRPDGNIEFIGRDDQQVKVRGYRIELGEIETQLTRCDGVKEAIVVARQHATEEKRLIAYITRDNEGGPNVEKLRLHLKSVLPDYMIPSAFVLLERMPLTPNGKVDRRALPEPDLSFYISRQYESPQGETEQTVAEIWEELLHVERVGRDDNFFEAGGHSLLAMQLIVRIRSLMAVEVPVRSIFDCPTMREFSDRVDELRQARLLDEISSGDGDIRALLERVAAMPESEVQKLMESMTRGTRQ